MSTIVRSTQYTLWCGFMATLTGSEAGDDDAAHDDTA